MTPAASVAGRFDAQAAHERQRAARALLMQPLLSAERDPDAFRLVRRHAHWLKERFAHETGWVLTVDMNLARLRKVPPTLDDGSRGARARSGDPPFSRRRYVLLCLALASLETADRQIALGRLAELVVASVAADPSLSEAGIAFDLDSHDQRRDLVAVVRLLIGLGVLRWVHGDVNDYLSGGGDALYTIDRSALAGVLAARRPPSTVDGPDLGGRLAALTHEPVPDSPDARHRATRVHLIRRLVDDAVLYYDELDADQLSYLHRQRHRILTAVEELTGLIAEVRSEGIAMVDDRGDCTDVEMPDQGTDGHLTLLMAEHLAGRLRVQQGELAERAGGRGDHGVAVPLVELEAFTAAAIAEHHAHWRRDVRQPGAEVALTSDAVARLAALGLARVTADGVVPLPAVARYAVGEPTVPDMPPLFD